MRPRQDGFTLIELLVVIIVLAILAAIAVPVFIRQREKGYQAQVQSALKNASTAIEAYGAAHYGKYAGLETEPDLRAALAAEGFHVPAWATAFDVVATTNNYCVEIRHGGVAVGMPWRRATYLGNRGAPAPSPDICPAAPSL